jgi:hypothetical protein
MRRFLAAAMIAALLVSGSADAHPRIAAGTILHTFRGDQPGEHYGFAVSQLTDIDHDGVQDILIGAPFHTDPAGHVDGHLDVISGRTGTLIYRFTGAPDDRLGYAMADAGDVNGDHIHDIVVGAPGVSQLACTAGVTMPGSIYIFSGRDGSLIEHVTGEAAGDQFGDAVGAAGDVDGDGHADVLVGAPCHDGPAGADAGAGYVISGRTGKILRRYDGAQAGDGYGWGAAGLPGSGDYIFGAKDAGTDDRGLAYVYDARTNHLRFTLAGNDQSMEFGWFFVATAGDVDHDGVPDIYVGDFCGDDPAGDCSSPYGQAYVFSGRTGRQIRLYTGIDPNDGAGPGRSAGDVDHDGYADVVVGLYSSSAAAPFGGRAVVFSGRTGAKLFDYADPTADDTLGYDAVGIGDTNHDGRVDLLLAGAIGDVVYVMST